MFAVIFAFMLVTTYAAEIPSYINVCGRQNLNQCIKDNMNNLKSKICEGLTDLNIPPLEPLNIDKLVISETANNKIYLNNVQITGLCDFIINSVSVDLDKIIFNIDTSFNRLYLNGTYDIDIHILVPIAYKAPIYLTTDNASIKIIMQASKAIKKGIEHLYVSELKSNIDVKGYDAQYGLKENELSQLGQILGGLIGSNQEEFLQRLIPSLEEEISKWLISIVNSVFKTFSYEQLFPHRT
ncbi:Putative beta-carotene-binding protein [Camponotus floridanus]|uniref:Putative beta-carotene-binding protein n=1 Tax=Camponotus floridanus TaxID=104421 RepID=E2AZB0_CAMFO|nr:Putative beta-carotene-binding protein [Camponotus floridanus]